jgi:phosphohistidine phosphatase
MKRLTLIRHAKAEPATNEDQDWERALTKRGENDASEMGKRLRGRHLKPNLLITSPAKRTARTAELIAAELRVPAKLIQNEDRLYLASPAEILKVIRNCGAEVQHLMICGHNPGLSEFADQLAKNRRIDNMPTCGVVTAQFAIENWSDFESGEAHEIEFDYLGQY